MKYRSNSRVYENAINVIDREINDVELSTILFVKASEAFFGDAEESMKLIDSTHNVYLHLRKEGWERERAIEVGVPIAVACYVKEYEEKENLKWVFVYIVVGLAVAFFISTAAPIDF